MNKLQTLPMDGELSSLVGAANGNWHDTALQLDRLRSAALEQYTATQLPAYRELAATLLSVLQDYDGTPSQANKLRIADLTPQACPADSNGFPSCGWEVLAASVQVPTQPDAVWTCPRATLFANYIVASQSLLARIVDPLVARAAEDLSHFAEQWKRYVSDGYSQYPHEVWVNGRLFLNKQEWGPPRNQLIALHPAVGFGTANLTEVADGNRAAAFVLVVEAVGYIRYLGDFRHHVGVSLAGALPNLDGDFMGIGPVAHFDGFGVGYNFGLKGDQPPTLFVLLDITRNIDDRKLLEKASGVVREWLH